MSVSEFGRSSKSSARMANRLSLLGMLVFCLVMSQFIFDLLPIEEFCGLSFRFICMYRSIPVCMVEELFFAEGAAHSEFVFGACSAELAVIVDRACSGRVVVFVTAGVAEPVDMQRFLACSCSGISTIPLKVDGEQDRALSLVVGKSWFLIGSGVIDRTTKYALFRCKERRRWSSSSWRWAEGVSDSFFIICCY